MCWSVSFHSPPWCTSSRPEGDWPSTLAPSPPAVCPNPSSAPRRTLWAHDSPACFLEPHWSCLWGAEGDRITPVRFLQPPFPEADFYRLLRVCALVFSFMRSNAHFERHHMVVCLCWVYKVDQVFPVLLLETGGWEQPVKKKCRVSCFCNPVNELLCVCLLYLQQPAYWCTPAEKKCSTLTMHRLNNRWQLYSWSPINDGTEI